MNQTETQPVYEELNRASEKLEFALWAGNAIGSWDWDIKNNKVVTDEKFARLFSVPPDLAAAGVAVEKFVDGIHPGDRDRVSVAIQTAIENAAEFLCEYRLLPASGELLWVRARGRPVFDEHGAPLRFPGVAVDITEQRTAELKREQADLLNVAQRRVLECAVGEGKLGDTLEEITRIVEDVSTTGVLASILLCDDDGKHLRHGAAPSLPSAYNEQIDGIPIAFGIGSCGTAAYTNKPVFVDDIATDPLWKDFSDLALAHSLRSCWSTPILSSSGKLMGTFAMYHRTIRSAIPADLALVDVVVRAVALVIERKKSEARLSESEARYRTLFDSIDEGFCIIEFLDRPDEPLSDYVHVQANGAYARHTGITNVVGQKVRDMVPDEAEGWVDLYRRVLLTGEPMRFERELEATGRHLELAAFRVEPASKRQVAVLFQDVTQRKVAEAALRDLNETLEARVAQEVSERSKTEEALRQSQKMEAVGQLTGGLAHDFNNLLAGISGSLELMQSRLTQGRMGDLERYMLAAQGAAKRAAALTHRLLAFSRRQTLDPKATNLNTLINGMEELIRRTVGPAITVETVTKAGLWPTLVDPNQLENALLNLCINARDAMPDGGKLTIETGNRWLDDRAARERDLPAGQYISMCVSDNGCGMTADILEKAFDPFFTTKPIGFGTGLGLSMVYGFARQSEGQVRAYSEPGKGTMVCIYLPRHLGPEARSDIAHVNEQVAAAQPGETILVVEDEPLVRMLVVDVLEELGYRTVEVSDGPQALKVIQSKQRIDLLITDVGLPNGMNGRQVAEAARQFRPGLKVLFATGYAENAVLSHGHLDHGMHVITKPFVLETLATKVRNIIEKT